MKLTLRPSTCLGFITLAALQLGLTVSVQAQTSGALSAVGILNAESTSATLGDRATALPFKVVRRGDASEAVSFRYSTADGTARAGRDYRPAAGIATIPAGQTSVTLPVEVLGKPVGGRTASAMQLILQDALSVAAPTDALSFSAGYAGSVGRNTPGMASADFNGDGAMDIVLASNGPDNLSVLLNGSPARATRMAWMPTLTLGHAAAPDKPVACDLNNDGRPDIAAATPSTNRFTVQMNTTPARAMTASFVRTDVTSLPWGYMRQMACADFDGDGRLDLVGAGFGSNATAAANTNRAIVFRNLTAEGSDAAVFEAPRGYAAHPTHAYSRPTTVVVGDFNGDGRPDLALGHEQSNQVTVLLNTTPAGSAQISFAPGMVINTIEGPSDLAVLDIDGDGRQDIVTANAGANASGATWSLLVNRTPQGASTPVFTAHVRFIGGVPYGVTVADMDLDGRPDVLVTYLATGDSAAGSVGVLLNRTAAGADTPSFLPAASIFGFDEPRALAAADFNRDGLPDVVAADFSPSASQVLDALQSRTVKPRTVGRAATGRILP